MPPVSAQRYFFPRRTVRTACKLSHYCSHLLLGRAAVPRLCHRPRASVLLSAGPHLPIPNGNNNAALAAALLRSIRRAGAASACLHVPRLTRQCWDWRGPVDASRWEK